jgi:hypothetical protein
MHTDSVVVVLNLRGRVFKTYNGTLLKKEGTFF